MNSFRGPISNVYSNQYIILFTLAGFLTISAMVALVLGSYKISLSEVIFGEISELSETVLFQIRSPRVIFSMFAGASLALSGACLQGLFRNPLADPGLIGVSAGAALGAASIIVIGSSSTPSFLLSPYMVPMGAILGSSGVIFLLYTLTKGFESQGISYMLLAGIAINALVGVCIGILTYISNDAELRGLTFWTMGSFGGVTWPLVLPAIIVISINLFWIFKFSRSLDILQLGESEAYRLGVDVKKLKFAIIISSAMIVGISVSLSGMIGFVGLVIPHLVRMMGGVNNNYVLPASAILGASLMVVSDLVSRVVIQPAELPIGLITSALGSPFFLWLILKIKKYEH